MTNDERLAETLHEIVGMIEGCLDAPRNPDSLVQMVLVRARQGLDAATSRPEGPAEFISEMDSKIRPTTLLPDGRHIARDYTPDERRVCDYLQSIIPDVGCGSDPIGFLIASHGYLARPSAPEPSEPTLQDLAWAERETRLAAEASAPEPSEALLIAAPFAAFGGGPDMQAYHDLDEDVVVWNENPAGVKGGSNLVTAGDERRAREAIVKATGQPVSMMHFRRAVEPAPEPSEERVEAVYPGLVERLHHWHTRAEKAEAELSRQKPAIQAARTTLREAEAILGGEYGDTYGVLCERMLDLDAKLAALSAIGTGEPCYRGDCPLKPARRP